jgi:O-acetyl-ADP-ribose deacetylase (regulator of RNase III)
MKTIKGDLFKDAPKGAILTHACNAQGRWSSGIANVFATLYPMAYTKCKMFCVKNNKSRDIVGRGMIFSDEIEDLVQVGCLFTSHWYGQGVDSPDHILQATEISVKELLSKVSPDAIICSPKINSKLFKTPWPLTEAVIDRVVNQFNQQNNSNIEWIVYDLDV